MPYANEAQVVELANDTVYGLAGYVQSGDLAHARREWDKYGFEEFLEIKAVLGYQPA